MAMANFRSVGSLFSSGSLSTNSVNNNRTFDDVVYEGVLSKRKNMKTRYFVLRKETSKDSLARLEYYDYEKKFKDGRQPKKKYLLKDYSMICRKSDAKSKYMVALYTHKDSVSFIAQSELEMNIWLKHINNVKHGTSEGNSTVDYEHVWQVCVLPRSFTTTKGLVGQQFLCLTNRLLSLVRSDSNDSKPQKKEFQLNTFRRCGHANKYFFIELGRLSPIGSGMLWMTCGDPYIARNVNEILGNAMNHIEDNIRPFPISVDRSRIEPLPRGRSDSLPAIAQYPSRKYVQNTCHIGSPGSNESDESTSEDDAPFTNVTDFEEKSLDDYTYMSPTEVTKALSPFNVTTNMRTSMDYTDFPDDGCLDEMDPVDPPVHNPSLHVPFPGGTSPRCSTTTPLSPGSSGNFSWIPQSPSHSRSFSMPEDTNDGYTIMSPPISLSSNYGTDTRPYVEMICIDKKSAPIPVNSYDGDSYQEMSPNSGSSSFTSSSDQRNQDLGSGLSGEEIDLLDMRPIRTSSVGSRTEQYKRKNRLDAVTIAEPARVRAFSVGSRVSLKFGVGRPGGAQPSEPPADNLGELFPSIKETGNRAKNKSSSVPMLAASWSGTTPGSYFIGSQGRSQQHIDEYYPKMVVDLTKKNKSDDYIPDDDKDSKTSMEKLWHTLKNARKRTSSKSSGNSKSSEGDSLKTKRLSESESRNIDIPVMLKDESDYIKIDFNPSPRNSSSDICKGYMHMHPPNSSLLTQNNFQEPYMVSDIEEPYMDMGQGNSSIGTVATTSSSPVTSRISGFATMASQEQLPSPVEDFMALDLQLDTELSSSHCKDKKGKKRNSFKDKNKAKVADNCSIKGDVDVPDNSHKSKASNAISTLTSLISRKPSSSKKAPLSPQGSPLPKAAKDSLGPFSSLTRKASKTKEEHQLYKENLLDLDVHRRSGSFSSHLGDSSRSPISLDRKRHTGSMDITTHFLVNREDEKMFFDPIIASKIFDQDQKSDVGVTTTEKRRSAYMNLNLSNEDTRASLPSLNNVHSPNYVNMQPDDKEEQTSVTQGDEESSYMLMTAPLKTKVNFSNIAQRPIIPSTLLVAQSTSVGLEKLAINDEQVSSERCRSHSGPECGAPDKAKKRTDEGRASSACSSPVSCSPPTSPTLGSVSSLSEGGLSSASSTCTIINVAVANPGQVAAVGTSKSNPPDSSIVVPKPLSDESSCSKVDDSLNYACLDLSEGNNKKSPKLHPKVSENISVATEETTSSYVAIDFTKSEGLRNTSLARDASRPH